jgi:hypothetical protein
MKRLTFCLTFLLVMSLPFVAQAGAKKASAPSQTASITIPALVVDVVNPVGNVGGPFLHVQANVTNADTLGACVTRHLTALPVDLPVPCNLVTNVTWSIDGQFVGQDSEAPYSMGVIYRGPSGRHTATAQAWRNVQSDFGTPVLLGEDSQGFCLNNCSS